MIVNGINSVKAYKVLNGDGVLCHMCFSLDSAPVGRTDLVDGEEGLQIACINEYGTAGRTKFEPHFHLWRPRTIPITQEAWIVISGQVKVTYFDEAKRPLGYAVLSDGDITITLRGGHGYEILDGGEIYEVKLGPFSATDDKEYLG